MRARAFLFALLLTPPAASAASKEVPLRTADGCELSAFYLAPSSGAFVFVNTHGLGSDKEEWAPFQAALAKAGFGYLSLDMRGHGGSAKCGGKPVSYRSFTPADWNAASRDIEAASAWLARKGVPLSRQVFCGASIGANLSLKAAAEGAAGAPAGVALLSPGLDYAGVPGGPWLAAGRRFRLFIAASQDDPYAWRSSAALSLAANRNGLKVRFVFGKGGHGVAMFRDPEFAGRLTEWILEK